MQTPPPQHWEPVASQWLHSLIWWLLKGDYSFEAKRIQHWDLMNRLHHPQDTSSFPSQGTRHPSVAILVSVKITYLVIPAEYKEWTPQRYVQPGCLMGKVRDSPSHSWSSGLSDQLLSHPCSIAQIKSFISSVEQKLGSFPATKPQNIQFSSVFCLLVLPESKAEQSAFKYRWDFYSFQS